MPRVRQNTRAPRPKESLTQLKLRVAAWIAVGLALCGMTGLFMTCSGLGAVFAMMGVGGKLVSAAIVFGPGLGLIAMQLRRLLAE